MRKETRPPVIGADSFPYANMEVTLKSASETHSLNIGLGYPDF